MKLNEEFFSRKSRRPSYSLRAFARDTGIAVSTLSEYLSGRSTPPLRKIEKLAALFGWSAQDLTEMKAHREENGEKQASQVKVNLAETGLKAEIAHAVFVLSRLPYLDQPSVDPQLISDRFGFSVSTVKKALQFLVANDLIRLMDGRYVQGSQTCTWIDVKNGTPTIQLSKFIVNGSPGPSSEQVFFVSHVPLRADDLPKVAERFRRLLDALMREIEMVAAEDIYSFVLAAVPARGRVSKSN